MAQFQSGSTRKLSITGLVAPQQVKPTIGDDITNAINTTVRGVSDVTQLKQQNKEREEVSTYHQHAQLYNEIKRKYIDANREAVTADEKRIVFSQYSQQLDEITNSPVLTDKYKVQLQRAANRDLVFASSHYEGTLRAEQKSLFNSAIADVVSAVAGADLETKYDTYKSFLDAAGSYKLSKAEAAEMFSRSLVDATKVNLLQEGTSYEQAVQAEEEILELLSKDIFSKGKSYMTKAKEEMFNIKNTIANRNKTELQAFVASEQYSLEEKEAKINQGAEEGWLPERLAYSLIEGVRSDEFVKQRSAARILQDAKLQNIFGIEEDEARAIAYDPKAGLSEDASRAKLEAWKSNRANAQRQLNIANFDNLIRDESIDPSTKIPILEQKIATETDPMQKAKYESQLVKVRNNLRDETVKSYENIIRNKKASFEEGLYAVNVLKEKGLYSETEADKEIANLLVREEKRIAQVTKENQIIEKMLKKGQMRVFKAQIRDKSKSPDELISIIDSAPFLLQSEKDMYKSLLSEGSRREVEQLIKENKRLDVALSKDRKTILNAVVKNPEYPLAYKITKINESNDYSAEEKKTMVAELRQKAYKEQEKYQRKLLEEEKTAYRNMAKQYNQMSQNGDMSINTEQWVNAIAIGWAGDEIPESVWGQYNKFTKQKELYDAFKAGVPVSNPERYANVYLKNIPEIEDRINSIKDIDSITPDSLQQTLRDIKIAEQNRYAIPNDVAKLARVARQLTAYNTVAGAERFKTYLSSPQSTPTAQQRQAYYNIILQAAGVGAQLVGNSAINDIIDVVVNSSMNKNESVNYIKDVIENDFIAVDRWFGEDYLVRKGTDYMRSRDDFDAAVRILTNEVGYKIKAVIPIDSTDPDSTDWLALPSDDTDEPIRVTNEKMRLLGSN